MGDHLAALRHAAGQGENEPAQRVDRLLVAGILEARGCERFGLIASALPPGPLKIFYGDITRSEVRHEGLYVSLALLYFDPPAVETRLDELLEAEARIVAELPNRPALH